MVESKTNFQKQEFWKNFNLTTGETARKIGPCLEKKLCGSQ